MYALEILIKYFISENKKEVGSTLSNMGGSETWIMVSIEANIIGRGDDC